MSIIPLNSSVGIVSSIGLSLALQSIIFPRGFSADVTVEERHTDLLTVTDDPVEQGAEITDHAFKRPAELLVRIGYSDSSSAAVQGAGLATIGIGSALSALNSSSGIVGALSNTTGLSLVAAAVTTDYVEAVYNLFLVLQASRVPFGLITGKRIYNTLLITSLRTVTTEEWENSMILEVEMREVILVNTQAVSVPSSVNMANPQVNGATQPTGNNQMTPGTAFNYPSAPFSAGFAMLTAG